MNNKPKTRVNGKFAKKQIDNGFDQNTIAELQKAILAGYNDVKQITEVFDYLYPEKKHIYNYPAKRRAVFMHGQIT